MNKLLAALMLFTTTAQAVCIDQYETLNDTTTTATRSGLNIVYDGDRVAGQKFGYNYELKLREWVEFDGLYFPNAMAGEEMVIADLIQYVPSAPYGQVQGEPIGTVVGTFTLTRNGYFPDVLHGYWTKTIDLYGEACEGTCEGPIDFVLLTSGCE